MEKGKIYQIFDVNTDAIATNRGFYYQYLNLLKKWITNYTQEKQNDLYSEVDDDIKEVGEELILTQVKCYSTNFSFNSEEIKKSLFNFFMHFFKYHKDTPLQFHFSTNTGVSQRDKLLKAWVNDPTLGSQDIKSKCVQRVRDIILDKIKQKKRQRLTKSTVASDKKDIKEAAHQFIKQASTSFIETFIDCIYWNFDEQNPDEAIVNLSKEIDQLLGHKRFQGKPPIIIKNALLSEIYKCSQETEKKNRKLNSLLITQLLEKTDEELFSYANHKFIKSLTPQGSQKLQTQVDGIAQGQQILQQKVNSLEHNAKKTKLDKSLPKELTFVPPLFQKEIFGRDHLFPTLTKALEQNSIVRISNSVGSGKSFFVRHFMEQKYADYKHIVWMQTQPDVTIASAIASDYTLIENLQIELPANYSVEQRLDAIFNRLKKVTDLSLFIVVDYTKDNPIIRRLMSLRNWHVIITTKEVIDYIPPFILPQLDDRNATQLYAKYAKNESLPKPELLKDFFNFVNYNPSFIKLSAQTIGNSLDLTLSDFFNHLKSQSLDDINLDIDLFLPDEDQPTQLLRYFKQKIISELDQLSEEDKYGIEFLALLPSDNIIIDELIEIGGKPFYKENKRFWTNVVNSLYRKGWIERQSNQIKMNRLIQEMIKYQLRKGNSPFFSKTFWIQWLQVRIDENFDHNPNLSFKFLKYGESILVSIKEPYRVSVNHVLLLLENAILNTYEWTNTPIQIHNRWIDLVNRAEKHFRNIEKEEKQDLYKDIIDLGIFFNNIARSYGKQEDRTNAVLFYQKAIQEFNQKLSHNKRAKIMLINTLHNLSCEYIKMDNLSKAHKTFKKISFLTKEYEIEKHQYIANCYYHLGIIYYKESETAATDRDKHNKLNESIKAFQQAITIHLSLDETKRNNFMLLYYYMHLSDVLFFQRDNKAIHYMEEVFNLLIHSKIDKEQLILPIYNWIIEMCYFHTDIDRAKQIIHQSHEMMKNIQNRNA